MGKIVVCMGKSSSGKDTIIKQLLKENKYHLQKIVQSTTRPIRFGEVNGKEYYFHTEEEMNKLNRHHQIIEQRKYNTEQGSWYYFTTSQAIDLENHNYITISTLEGLESHIRYYGKDKIISLLFRLDDGERLQRALIKEINQENPQYVEMCRHYLADFHEFSTEDVGKNSITKIIDNNGKIQETVEEVNKVLNLYL